MLTIPPGGKVSAPLLPLPLPGMEATGVSHLTGPARKAAADLIIRCHYTHSVPSGKSRYFLFDEAIIVFSLPANNNVSRFLLGAAGHPGNTWELSRLWAPDGHEPNLLTRAISQSAAAFHEAEPDALALISYADPNVGHAGGIYRAASWIYLGQVEDGRYYRSPDGQVVPRRKFHSGKGFTRKPGILDLGFTELTLPGRHRFAKGLTPGARRLIRKQQQARNG